MFHRVRQWLSLLLHLLIFTLLVLALARPERGGGGTKESWVVLLDTRARMGARTELGGTAMGRALEEARGWARSAREGREVALVTVGGKPRVLSPFTGDPAVLLGALEGVVAGDSGGDAGEAKAFGEALVAARGGAGGVVFLGRGVTATENAGITRFAARAVPGGGWSVELFCEVENTGAGRAKGRLVIEQDGVPVDAREWDLEPGETAHVVVPLRARAGRGLLRAVWEADDALAGDNVAYAAMPPVKQPAVLLVTDGGWFLERWFEAAALPGYQLVAPGRFDWELARGFDAVVFDRFLPPVPAPENAMAGIAYLGQPPTQREGEVKDPVVTDAKRTHPLMRYANVEDVRVASAVVAGLEGGWEAVVESGDAPLIAAREEGERREVFWAFDAEKSDLPLRLAFPLLLGNLVDWLTGAELVPVATVPAGREAVLPAGTLVAAEPITDAGAEGAKPLLRERVVLERAGWYATRRGEESGWLAVSLVDRVESDLRSQDAADGLGGVPPAAPASSGWWRWCALAALALFSLEWWWFHRRKLE